MSVLSLKNLIVYPKLTEIHEDYDPNVGIRLDDAHEGC